MERVNVFSLPLPCQKSRRLERPKDVANEGYLLPGLGRPGPPPLHGLGLRRTPTTSTPPFKPPVPCLRGPRLKPSGT